MATNLKIDKRDSFKLKDFDPGNVNGCDRDACIVDTDKQGQELADLQEWLYAAQTHSVLIVLQGMDTSGKDGTISHVFSFINPQGCAVASFKVPTPAERLHDFLWRVHTHTPARGNITIFNRSHYEDVLVTRVHKMIDKDTWQSRYEHIRNFEQLLADSNTIILKFFLHISKDEQEQRLLAREKEADKAWKLSAGDWQERKFWDEYQEAYNDAIRETAAKHAPWYIVPADHKWYRNYLISRTLLQTLKPYKDEWQKVLEEMGKQRLEELRQMRAANGKNGAKGQ